MSDQPRIIPTRAGWWWGRWLGQPAELVWVRQSPEERHAGRLEASNFRFVDLPQWEWIAPIPGPAVLAALAEYGEAVAGLDDSTRLPSDELGAGNRVTVGQAIQDFELSKARLTDAIRAERDGAA